MKPLTYCTYSHALTHARTRTHTHTQSTRHSPRCYLLDKSVISTVNSEIVCVQLLLLTPSTLYPLITSHGMVNFRDDYTLRMTFVGNIRQLNWPVTRTFTTEDYCERVELGLPIRPIVGWFSGANGEVKAGVTYAKKISVVMMWPLKSDYIFPCDQLISAFYVMMSQ